MSELLSITRYHIIIVAGIACLVFSKLITGSESIAALLFCCIDWFLINFLNRIIDLKEDMINNISGVSLVENHRNVLLKAFYLVLAFSLLAAYFFPVRLLLLRIVTLFTGFAYSLPLVPLKLLVRIKDIYFFKNFMSACLFVSTCFFYPLVLNQQAAGLVYTLVLIVFFILLEITFEILYDLRDEEGDIAAGIPTFVVVHGRYVAMRLVYTLLFLSALVLIAAFITGYTGVRELLFLFALIVQLGYFVWHRNHWQSRECINMTHLASLQLLVFYLANRAWMYFNLPENIFIRS